MSRVHARYSNFLAHLNVEDLPDNATSMKVLVLIPNGNDDPYSKRQSHSWLLKNLALKGWQAAANAFLKVVHEPTREDFLIALNRPVNKEFKEILSIRNYL